jgi:ATP diphosphatase
MVQNPAPDAALLRLLGIMARLRAPDGCPWDQVQDFASIAPYTIEEAYEVADAIARGPQPAALPDQLGDLLFQVVYHAQMAAEAGWFGFAEVAEAISEKMMPPPPPRVRRGRGARRRAADRRLGSPEGRRARQPGRDRHAGPGCRRPLLP